MLDKIPAVDTINDTIQTFIRPSMGGLIFAATTAAAQLDNSTWMKENPWVSVVLGVLISGLVHAGKMAARPVINVGTVGTGAPVVSTVEDIGSLGLSLIALIAPVLVILGLALLAWLLIWMWLRVRRWRRTRRDPAYTSADLTPGQPSTIVGPSGGCGERRARPQSVKVRSDGVALRPDDAQQGAAAVGGHPQPRARPPRPST